MSSSSSSSAAAAAAASSSSAKRGRDDGGGGGAGGGAAPAPFRGPAADSALGEGLLDVVGLVAALGYAADVSHCRELCGTTWRAGDKGATNDMLVQSLRRQCGAREARTAEREVFVFARRPAADDGDEEGYRATISGSTQLMRAAMLNNLPRVRQLIQLGAPLDLVDEGGVISALMHASDEGHEHVAEALLDGKFPGRGATVEQRSRNGTTALEFACFGGHEAVVRLLLSRGARPESQDDDGYTALHDALDGSDCPGIVALLCAAPGGAAAIALKNVFARTPLAFSISRGRTASEAVLRAHGATE